MNLEKNWTRILKTLQQGKRSNRFFSIATVDSDGAPHITPIGHMFFRDDMTGYYFDQYSEAMPKNFQSNKKICLMSVNSSTWFWLKSLFKAKFESAPAVRLMGEVTDIRQASEQEIDTLKKAISATKNLRGHKLLWNDLNKVRDIQFTGFSPAKYPVMCEDLWIE